VRVPHANLGSTREVILDFQMPGLSGRDYFCACGSWEHDFPWCCSLGPSMPLHVKIAFYLRAASTKVDLSSTCSRLSRNFWTRIKLLTTAHKNARQRRIGQSIEARRSQKRSSSPRWVIRAKPEPLMVANLLWSGQGIAVKLLAGGLGPLAIALLPLYFVTMFGLGILATRRNITQKFRAAWRLRREFFLAGICGQLMAQVGMTIGVSWSTASNATILSLLVPIFGALIAVWLLCERLSTLRVGALLLGLDGVLLLSPLHCAAGSRIRTHELVGNLLIATACLGSAFYNVYSKRLLDYFSGIEILFFSYLSTTAFSLPVLFIIEPHCLSNLARLTLTQCTAFGYLAVFLYGISMVFFLRALRMVDVVIASASLYLMPLFGVALAFSILGERLAPRAVLGSAIVLFATLILLRFDYAF
jgi:drug/metabolite transporter (DMT)-like permease